MGIKRIKMKPKVRLVPASAHSCIGCDLWQSHVAKAGVPFVDCTKLVPVSCVPAQGKFMHIKHVGEHPSTR